MQPDHWHAVAQYCTVQDLGRLMQVSRGWFHLWVTDRAWRAQRNRICAVFPFLEELFAMHPVDNPGEHRSARSIKSNTNKQRKKAWIIPRVGTWFVFKRWLARSLYVDTFKILGRESTWTARRAFVLLLEAVARSHLPLQEYIRRVEVTVHPPEQRRSGVMYDVALQPHLAPSEVGDSKTWLEMSIVRNGWELIWRGYYAPTQQTFWGEDMFADERYVGHHPDMRSWRRLVRGSNGPKTQWTPLLVIVMGGLPEPLPPPPPPPVVQHVSEDSSSEYYGDPGSPPNVESNEESNEREGMIWAATTTPSLSEDDAFLQWCEMNGHE